MKNPQNASSNMLVLTIGILSVGVALSFSRIQTVAQTRERQNRSDIRAQTCRILHRSQVLKPGYYYFQPTRTENGKLQGDLLPAGELVCDWYGNSGEVDAEGGAISHFIKANAAEQNSKLMERMKDKNSPDSTEFSQVREAENLPPNFKARPKANTPKRDGFFDPNAQ